MSCAVIWISGVWYEAGSVFMALDIASTETFGVGRCKEKAKQADWGEAGCLARLLQH